MIFRGSIPAVITPFLENFEIDLDSLGRHVDDLISNGSHGLVSCGTSGESPTLSHGEHEKVIELCVRESKGKLPVFAGTGSNSTEEAISLTTHA